MKNMELSLQKLDEWIHGVSECKLLSQHDVEILCTKVYFNSIVNRLGKRDTSRRVECPADSMSDNHLWRCSWPVP